MDGKVRPLIGLCGRFAGVCKNVLLKEMLSLDGPAVSRATGLSAEGGKGTVPIFFAGDFIESFVGELGGRRGGDPNVAVKSCGLRIAALTVMVESISLSGISDSGFKMPLLLVGRDGIFVGSSSGPSLDTGI